MSVFKVFLHSILICLPTGIYAGSFGDETSTDEGMFDDFEEDQASSALQLKGMLDARFGARLVSAQENKAYTLGEVRGNSEIEYGAGSFALKTSLDLYYTPLMKDAFGDIEHLQKGEGVLDIRELSGSYSLFGSPKETCIKIAI